MLPLVPWPERVERRDDAFELDATARIATVGSDRSGLLDAAARHLEATVARRTGLRLPLLAATKAEPRAISLVLGGEDRGEEGYRLHVSREQIVLSASHPRGISHGARTLAQLIQGARVPGVVVTDRPRLGWRGLLLDPARSFLSVKCLRRIVDLLADLKLCVLHLHLSDDQGFRFESRRYPKLHELGSKGATEGFYTQAELRDLVAYARERGVTIVPEIDLPGHVTAMLAAYPELSCSRTPREVVKVWHSPPNALCPSRESTYEFLAALLGEVSSVFDGPYFHVGGDEVVETAWAACESCNKLRKSRGLKTARDLQAQFETRIFAILERNKKRGVVWDEALHPSLAKDALVQAWRTTAAVVSVTAAKRRVIASPYEFTYFDGLTTERALSFDPFAGAAKDPALVVGAEGCLWGENASEEQLERRLLPPLVALAEVFWASERRALADFEARSAPLLARLLGRRAGGWSRADLEPAVKPLNIDVTPLHDLRTPVEVECLYEDGRHGIWIEKVELLEDGVVVAKDEHRGWSGAKLRANTFVLDARAKKPGAKHELRVTLRCEGGGTDSRGSIYVRDHR